MEKKPTPLPKLLPGALVGDRFVDGEPYHPPNAGDWIAYLSSRCGEQLVLPGLEPEAA